MATYEVTSPDGQTYKVTAPDGASEADVLAYAKQQFATPQSGPLDANDARALKNKYANRFALEPPAAVMAAGVPKAVAGLFDLAKAPFDIAGQYMAQKMGAPAHIGKSELPSLSPYAQGIENYLAGQDLSENNLAKLGSAAAQAPIFPGALGKNVVASVAGEGARQGAEAAGGGGVAQFLASLAGGIGGAKLTDVAKNARALHPSTWPEMLARSRVSAATKEVLPDEAAAAKAAQQYAQSQGSWISPWQSFGRDVPKLSELEQQIKGSGAKSAVEFQKRLREQLPESEKISADIVKYLTPRSQLSASADEAVSAANQAAGDIRRMPNVITAPLYEKGMTGVKPVAKTHLEAVMDRLGAMRAENKGNIALEKELGSMIEEIAKRTEAVYTSAGTLRPQKNLSAAEAVRLSDSFTDRLKDFAVQNPSQAQRATQIMKMAAGLLDEAAYRAQPSLERATTVNRVLREDFRVGDFDPLAMLGKTKAEPSSVIKGLFERGAKDPQEFAATIKQLEAKDVNAIPNTLGHHIRQAWDKAFSTKAFKEEAAPTIFAAELIGTKAKTESLRIALEATARANKSQNPAAYADGVIRQLELVRNLGKQGSADYSRLGETTQALSDAAKMGLPGQHELRRSGAATNIVMKTLNRISDEQVAKMLNRPDSVAEIMRGNIGTVRFQPTPYEMILLNAARGGLLGEQ